MADPPRPRQASQPYLPPPPETRDDSPESVDVPRMEHPPASLEAMVQSRPPSGRGRRDAHWFWIFLALIAAVGFVGYFLRRPH